MFGTIRTTSTAARAPAWSHTARPGADRPRPAAPGDRARSDGGFLLIEVIISSLLVALIVIATLTGFDVVNRTTASERNHSQAAVLAAQSQEQLRSDPASALDTIVGTGHEHVYTQTIGGTTYTITQSAKDITPNGVATCNVKEKTSSASYLQITSTVSWPGTGPAKHREVSQASVITPPDGSGLEVDVISGASTSPSVAVPGAKVIAEYQSAEAELPTSVETITGSEGCALYNGIPSTTAKIQVSKTNFVAPEGSYLSGPREVTIAPNITTHRTVELAEGGAIEAEFQHEGKTSYEYEAGKPEAVRGDTFVVYNHLIGVSPEFLLGSTKVTTFENGTYEGLTGTYASKATTPISAQRFATGDLFPFLEKPWAVYAGDCTANSPETVTSKAVANGSVTVSPGRTVKVAVPTSYVRVTVYKGTSSKNEGVETVSLPVKITNVSCQTASSPNDATKLITTHEQGTNNEGHLEDPFQPFGKFELCVYDSALKHRYNASYTSSTAAGPSPFTIYLKETKTEKAKSNTSITITENVQSC